MNLAALSGNIILEILKHLDSRDIGRVLSTSLSINGAVAHAARNMCSRFSKLPQKYAICVNSKLSSEYRPLYVPYTSAFHSADERDAFVKCTGDHPLCVRLCMAQNTCAQHIRIRSNEELCLIMSDMMKLYNRTILSTETCVRALGKYIDDLHPAAIALIDDPIQFSVMQDFVKPIEIAARLIRRGDTKKWTQLVLDQMDELDVISRVPFADFEGVFGPAARYYNAKYRDNKTKIAKIIESALHRGNALAVSYILKCKLNHSAYMWPHIVNVLLASEYPEFIFDYARSCDTTFSRNPGSQYNNDNSRAIEVMCFHFATSNAMTIYRMIDRIKMDCTNVQILLKGAAHRGNLGLMTYALDTAANYEIEPQFGRLLMIAAANGGVEIAELLIYHAVKSNKRAAYYNQKSTDRRGELNNEEMMDILYTARNHVTVAEVFMRDYVAKETHDVVADVLDKFVARFTVIYKHRDSALKLTLMNCVRIAICIAKIMNCYNAAHTAFVRIFEWMSTNITTSQLLHDWAALVVKTRPFVNMDECIRKLPLKDDTGMYVANRESYTMIVYYLITAGDAKKYVPAAVSTYLETRTRLSSDMERIFRLWPDATQLSMKAFVRCSAYFRGAHDETRFGKLPYNRDSCSD